MPSSPGYKRKYKNEYAVSQSSEKEKKNRAKRNTARRQAMAAGKVSKGDGKDVTHKVPLCKGGGNGKANRGVAKASTNRSFKRTKSAGMK